MKTTVELDDGLLARSKKVAVEEGTSLKALIEEGLRHILARLRKTEDREAGEIRLPTCSQGGGVVPGVSLNDSSELEDLMNA